MKAMVLAAGLGTRLKPWTLEHPKALVPVQGVPMLERVLSRLEEEGFCDITVNVHHFASQIVDYLQSRRSKAVVKISYETELLLDTGGGIAHAAPLLMENPGPVLVHNVDILSNAPLRELMGSHIASESDVTLLVSCRPSSRRLFFGAEGRLRGWADCTKGMARPDGFIPQGSGLAFSGIYVVSPFAIGKLQKRAAGRPLPIMDFLLENVDSLRIEAFIADQLRLIDIGKPDTLRKAEAEGLP